VGLGSALKLAVKGDHVGVVQLCLGALGERVVALGTSAEMSLSSFLIQAIRNCGIVFGPKVSKLPAVKAVLKAERKCACCGKRLRNGEKYYKCSKCKLVYYCGPECQKQHWRNGHKEVCRALAPLLELP
jgi:hypothetical protein